MKTVFITGISSGIGKALALHFAEQKWQVYGVSRRQLDYQHSNIAHQKLDLTEPEELLQEKLTSLLSPINSLELAVLNAGVLGKIETLQNSPTEDLKKVMDVNLWGVKKSIDILLKLLPNTQQMVAFSSGASVKSNKGWGGYSLSKTALNMLMSIYASEVPTTHFCALAPGLVDTQMQETLSQIDAGQFPTLFPIQRSRHTDAMPTPENFAPRFYKIFEQLKKYESGSYLDLRQL